MDVRTEINYPGANLDDVMEMLLSEEFRERVCRATGALHHEVRVEPGVDGSTVATVSRTIPAVVPDLVRRMVGETLTVTQVERWHPGGTSDSRRADVELRVEQQPARLVGSLVVVQDAGGVREVLEGTLTVSIPLIGRRIEPEIAKAIVLGARREEETGLAWLA